MLTQKRGIPKSFKAQRDPISLAELATLQVLEATLYLVA